MGSSRPTKQVGRFGDQMRGLREDHLVQTASQVLLRSGCDAFRVEDVAAECGVAKGTCYRHFGSRAAFIAAAVRHLDEALGQQLSSPPVRLSTPAQILEWALLEAVDAQSLTLALRSRQTDHGAAVLEGRTWPCCLSRMPCPHGGAVRSLAALLRWTAKLLRPSCVP